jgi:hypothetical protein
VVTPAAEGHGLWPWMNAPAFGRDVAPLGREVGATGFARGAPQNFHFIVTKKGIFSPFTKSSVLEKSIKIKRLDQWKCIGIDFAYTIIRKSFHTKRLPIKPNHE